MTARHFFAWLQLWASLACAFNAGLCSRHWDMSIFLAGFAVFALAAWRESEGEK